MKYLMLTATAFASSALALTYPIVDTGQAVAYGSYIGQDAHYSANAPSYRDNGDGTVSDRVTGLMWTKDPGEKMTWKQAVRNASACRTGGYHDWRLPTIKELYSLINFNGVDPDPRSTETGNLTPFINNSVFDFQYGDPKKDERIIDSQFATSTIYTSTTMGGNKTMFGVNFADGRIKGYPVVSPRGEKTYFVLYVRGNPDYGKNKFKDLGDGTIKDEASGLMWMQNDSGKGMDWPTALEYAEKTEYAGHSDWRLPTAKELQSIVDYSRAPDSSDSAAIDPLFHCTPIQNEAGQKDYAQYWTSTTHISSRGTDHAAYICFGRGLGKMRNTWMDVHGAGCQRSDPKTGDIADYPQSHGPQGDAVRLYNDVRLVRGGNVKKKSPPVQAVTQRNGPGGPGPGASPQNHLMQRFDQNNDGRITEQEFRGPIERFILLDLDSDGIITEEEAASASRTRGPENRDTPPPFESAGTLVPAALPQSSPARDNLPNMIFIYADDMGWTGSSVEMIPDHPETKSDFYQTPNLEKLAARGMVFSQAYSPASMCTPSRAAVLTGKTPAELHITTPGGGRSDPSKKVLTPKPATELSQKLPTIGTRLKAQGYATALLGKWHIGRSDDAGHHGFDRSDGPTSNESSGTADDPKEIFSLTQRGIAFMQQSVSAGRPFYLQISHYAVHEEYQCRPDSASKFEKATPGKIHQDPLLAGMTWDLDASLADLFKAVENMGIADKTYIVFMSDNGAPGNRRKPNNTPLYGGKGTLYEGGIRVPLIIAGPGIKSGWCGEAVSGTDLFATFVQWAGATDQEPSESVSLQPLLTGNETAFKRTQPLLFHYPHYGRGPLQKPQTALIANSWKLIKDWESGTYRLFDLANDLGEMNDLSKSNPEKFSEMVASMDQRMKETAAQTPSPNSDYPKK